MNNSLFTMARPKNERVYLYEKGSKEREELLKELKRQEETTIEIPLIIGGKEVKTGNIGKVVMPHNHKHVLATYHKAGEKETAMAIEAAMEAKEKWQNTSWVERSAIMLKAAELLSKKYRYVINAATMLGQSKNSMQAEIDAACETIDFLRLNSYYLQQIYSDQPMSLDDQMNRMEYRPLEGFVYAITPFNFTSIAANLNLSPALLGNTTVWKPGTTAILSNYYLMKIFKEAGLPDGVVNFLPGSGATISSVVLPHKDLAGIHFTGSNRTFNSLWKQVGENLENYKSYPKIVGETGGKDFVFVHKSAEPSEVATAIVRGAFEFQGQKCSAASRSYIPESMWSEVKGLIVKMLAEIKMGEVKDFENFVNAVIDETSFDNII
ncbi:MAG: aldehyde dehydrogenase family protein, partial [Bacteroidales bacterium]|nr:aldehyde dehydrogenase family protein [Bacteroidales bacterium]